MKKIIDIIAIVLPALIILMSILRLFVKKTKAINGLIMLFAILLLLAGLIRYYVFPDNSSGSSGPKPPPLTVSKHSDSFNNSIETLLNIYSEMNNGFANSDTVVINRSGLALKTSLDSLQLEELKKDTTGIYESALDPIANAKAETESIIKDASLEEKRTSLNILSENIRLFLSIVQFDRSKIYWLECASAFGEDKPGNWLSKTEQSVNPYGQKDCAEVKTKIDFVSRDTTKKESDL